MKILLHISFEPTGIDVLRLFYSDKGVHRRRPVCTNSHRLANEPKYIIDKSPMEKLCPLYGFSIDSQIEFQVSIFTYVLRVVITVNRYIGAYNDYVDKKRWQVDKIKLYFCPLLGLEISTWVGVGQKKRAKSDPSSH